MLKESVPEPHMSDERKAGLDLRDRGCFEIDTSSGSVEWANEFALGMIKCSEEQLRSMSVFDLSPERFHEQIREDLAGEANGKFKRSYILPTRISDGRIAWWYVFKTRNHGSRRWAYAEHIQDTPQSGPEFSFMAVQMDMVNTQTVLVDRIDDLEQWVEGQIKRVDKELSEVQTSLEKAETAALEAAMEAVAARNAALATQKELRKYATKEDMARHFEKFDVFEEESTKATTEILRLIRTDTVHEERLRTYEEHVRTTTESAVKAIELQASKSGKGLSRKVTVPIFVVTTLAMVFQYIIQHWNIRVLF